ncbi:ferritin [Geomonas limicola]|uniref:Ferritin n=1 Tax=Geomonas limicola TaxID=2740186 RepID=A0A6V8N670_9BACT|nr:ferritin family protein [Geomonas limicola]GFO68072.1 ferritin [Geomonas limicola]
MNVFDCAIKIEEEARQYYETIGSQSRDPEMKHLFSMLAASEEEFRDQLMKMKAALPPEQAKADGMDGAVCSFRPLLTERELLEVVKDDHDLYQLSMREAEEEIKFYEELAAKTKDPATRNCLTMLAEEERRHLQVVENIYEFVEAPKTFLAWGEFSNLKDL